MDKKHVIINSSEKGSVDYSQVLEDSEETLRESLSGDLALIRYFDSQPESVVNLKSKSQEYNREEILTILSGEDWTAVEEDDDMI
tara:strand:- start:414 stop:668 length:255 start_codon:yes stop_codon:yes gene_type:complete